MFLWQRNKPTPERGPAPDFAKIAQGFGVYAEGPIEEPNDLGPALKRALKVVKEDRLPALVDVVTQRA